MAVEQHLQKVIFQMFVLLVVGVGATLRPDGATSNKKKQRKFYWEGKKPLPPQICALGLAGANLANSLFRRFATVLNKDQRAALD